MSQLHDPNCGYCARRKEEDNLNSTMWAYVVIYIAGGVIILWLGNTVFNF